MKRGGPSDRFAGSVDAPASKPFSIPIASIAIGERIGFFNEPHAVRLGKSIRDEGQRAPIQVKRNGNAASLPWTLVAGLHRLRGAQMVGINRLDAIEVAQPGSSNDDLIRLELAENITHRFRRPIERAIMMVAYARLEEAIDHPDHVGETPQNRALRVRHSTSVTVTDIVGWRERTAAAFDCRLSTFEKHQRIHRTIVEELPDLAQALNEHPLGESLRNMLDIAAIRDPGDRRKAADLLLSRLDWKNMSAVLVAAGVQLDTGKKAKKPDAIFRRAWVMMKPQERRDILIHIAEEISQDLAIELIDILKGKLP